MSNPTRWRRARRGAGVAALGLGVASGGMVADAWEAFGKAATGERRARMEASPEWTGSRFQNPQPLWNDALGSFRTMFQVSDYATPEEALPVVFSDGSQLAVPPATGLRVTWLGHSTLVVQIDGTTVLTDPIWGQRASPWEWVGPERWYDPPIPLPGLPPVDAVVLSHDHYDHLSKPTIEMMKDWDTTFVVPLGVGAHLAYWGVPQERIVELDWWETTTIGSLELTCTPARHASGRHLLDQNTTLWAGWALRTAEHRVFFSGDTGLFPALADIGERLGPFDLTMIEVGAYNRSWPDWHIGPEQAIQAHQMLRGEVFLPIHWGMWNLAMHGWTEPVERVGVAAEAAGVTYAVPRPGESFEPESLLPQERWWPDVPWDTAEQHPIVSTAMGDSTAAR